MKGFLAVRRTCICGGLACLKRRLFYFASVLLCGASGRSQVPRIKLNHTRMKTFKEKEKRDSLFASEGVTLMPFFSIVSENVATFMVFGMTALLLCFQIVFSYVTYFHMFFRFAHSYLLRTFHLFSLSELEGSKRNMESFCRESDGAVQFYIILIVKFPSLYSLKMSGF